MQVLYDHGVAENLFALQNTFSWPGDDRMPAMCRELQRLGCCAFSFQRMLTALLVATCRIDAGIVATSLSSACEAAGAPLWASHTAAACFRLTSVAVVAAQARHTADWLRIK